jgi:hypothetical protein
LPATISRKPKVTVWVGSRKGGFALRSTDRKHWEIQGPLFPGADINHIAQDPRDPRTVYAGVHTLWFGPHLHVSRNGGKTWKLSEAGMEMKCVPDTSLKRIWYIQPGHADEPGVVWVGGEPAVLFRSEDWGRNWTEVTSLTAHSTRPLWSEAMGSISLHSIQCPAKGHVVNAISVGGTYRSADSGATWTPFNQNVRADFLPGTKRFPEVG